MDKTLDFREQKGLKVPLPISMIAMLAFTFNIAFVTSPPARAQDLSQKSEIHPVSSTITIKRLDGSLDEFTLGFVVDQVKRSNNLLLLSVQLNGVFVDYYPLKFEQGDELINVTPEIASTSKTSKLVELHNIKVRDGEDPRVTFNTEPVPWPGSEQALTRPAPPTFDIHGPVPTQEIDTHN